MTTRSLMYEITYGLYLITLNLFKMINRIKRKVFGTVVIEMTDLIYGKY